MLIRGSLCPALLSRVGAESWLPLDTRLVRQQCPGSSRLIRVFPRANTSSRPLSSITLAMLSRRRCVPMVRQCGSTFPLRARVELRTSLGEGGATGQTVPYGTKSRGSRPVARPQAASRSRSSRWSWWIASTTVRSIPRAERPAVTDEDGRFSVPEPAGPTRSIEATFAGSSRYLPAHDEVGKFAVKGEASFRVSDQEIPEGSPVTFNGPGEASRCSYPGGRKARRDPVPPEDRTPTNIEAAIPHATQWRLPAELSVLEGADKRCAIPFPRQSSERGKLAVQGLQFEVEEGGRPGTLSRRNVSGSRLLRDARAGRHEEAQPQHGRRVFGSVRCARRKRVCGEQDRLGRHRESLDQGQGCRVGHAWRSADRRS